MARKAKAKTVAEPADEISVLNEVISETDNPVTGIKHIALEHLYIIKEYIDAGDKKNGGLGGSVLDTEGVHDLRIYNGKIQYKEKGFWLDVAAVGSDVGNITSDEGIHGLRIAEGRLQYSDGEKWIDVIGGSVTSAFDGCTIAKNSEVEDLFN